VLSATSGDLRTFNSVEIEFPSTDYLGECYNINAPQRSSASVSRADIDKRMTVLPISAEP
jgi:hypothetical protein